VMYCLLKLISGDFFSFFNKIKSIIFSTLGMIFILKLIDCFIIGDKGVQSLWGLTLIVMIGVFCYFSFLMVFSFQFRYVIIKKLKK
ncbi:hypothetical protein, partial [Klebsiella michiganensis]